MTDYLIIVFSLISHINENEAGAIQDGYTVLAQRVIVTWSTARM